MENHFSGMYLSQGLFQKGNLLKVIQGSRLESLTLIRSNQYAIMADTAVSTELKP